MRAVCWEGKEKIQVETVPDPEILNPRDAIIKVTTTAICGSDLHLYDGYIPTMQKGDILGHEFMGEVVEVGEENTRLKVGDRVVVPFTIACGRCFFCREQLWSLCDNSNPNAWMAEKLYGYSGVGSVRLLAHVRRLCRRPGGIRARAVRRRRAAQGPGLHSPTSRSSFCPTSSRPATWRPRTATSSRATRSPSGAAARSASSRSRARTCSAPSASSRSIASPNGSRWHRAGPSGDAELRRRRRARRAPGPDRRTRTGRLHRRGRPGSPRHDARRVVRPGQDGDVPRHRSPARAAPGDQRLPQGRHGLDPRRLWRIARQVSAGRGVRARA